jgi:leader peptidase (prepilin peptidase)/N-methyltransferase
VAATAVVMGFATGPVLRRLPEPLDGDGKTTYRDLATTRFILGCVLLSALAQVLALASEPVRTLPLWTVLATAGVLLAAIDGRTTWLPLTLTRLAWTLMAAAVLLAVALGGSPATLLRTLLGAGAAGGLYLLVWAVSRGGFGFGDVRFAPLLGAATAAHSWTLLIWALTLGTALGALHGMSRLLRRLQGGFPYAPSMLGGSYLATVALAVFSGGRSP